MLAGVLPVISKLPVISQKTSFMTLLDDTILMRYSMRVSSVMNILGNKGYLQSLFLVSSKCCSKGVHLLKKHLKGTFADIYLVMRTLKGVSEGVSIISFIKRHSCQHMEISPLICGAKQLAGFYMVATLAV